MNSTINISDKPLLESLLNLDFPSFNIDLHNDFDCVGMKILEHDFSFHFLNSEKQKLEILLSDYKIVKQEVVFNFSGPITLDNFYIGRIEHYENLIDIDVKGRHCFYFHFCENFYLEILAKAAKVIFTQ